MSTHRLRARINHQPVDVVVEGRISLLDFLREGQGLHGAHAGCEHGVCGACTVLVDGRSARACLMLAVQADGAEIITVEGLNAERAVGELGDLQSAFWQYQALQCGYCTPGMLIRAHEFLLSNPTPTAAQVREAISTNLCRCTGYEFIIQAVLQVAQQRADAAND